MITTGNNSVVFFSDFWLSKTFASFLDSMASRSLLLIPVPFTRAGAPEFFKVLS